MSNPWFEFKHFTIRQDRSAMKVGTDGVLLGAWANVIGAKRILDIGTGTGLIAIMLAQRSKGMVDAIEPDPDSFLQARDNIRKCPWKERIRITNQSLQEFIKEESIKGIYDLIVTNPPYFIDSKRNPDEKKRLSRHADSLKMSDILNGTDILLNEEGRLCLILPAMEATQFQESALAMGFYCNSKLLVKPTPDKDVLRILMQFERKEKECRETSIVIEVGGRHILSHEYRELTKEFYLGF